METTAAPLTMPAAPSGVDRARRRRHLIGVAILIVAACVLPFLVGNYRVFQLTLALVVIVGVLVVRPSGMFGRVNVVRV